MKNLNGAFFAKDEDVWIQAFKSSASKMRELFEVKDEVENNRIGLIRPGFLALQNPHVSAPRQNMKNSNGSCICLDPNFLVSTFKTDGDFWGKK